MVLARSKISSFRDISLLEDSALEALPISAAQKDAVRSLKLREAQCNFFLPGDIVAVSSLAGKNLDLLLNHLATRNLDEIKQKLEQSGVTIDTLKSPALTGEELKALGLPLGLRKAILSWREREATPWKVVAVRDNGTFEITCTPFGKGEAHSCLMSLIDDAELFKGLSEMGISDREAVTIALQTLKLTSFAGKLEAPEGQRILDLLLGGAVDNEEASGHGAGGKSDSVKGDGASVAAADAQAKAREKVNNYAAVLAILRCMRQQRPFPLFFEMEVRRSLAPTAPRAKGSGSDEAMPDRCLLSDEDFRLGVDNAAWTVDLDAAVVLLLAEGRPYMCVCAVEQVAPCSPSTVL